MRYRFPLVVLVFLFLAFASKPNPSDMLQLQLDGKKLDWTLDPPQGLMGEIEAGMNMIGDYSIFFAAPRNRMEDLTRQRVRGLRIMFEPRNYPKQVSSDGVITFGSKELDDFIMIEYNGADKYHEGQVPSYGSWFAGGSGSIRLDHVDFAPGGRVQGMLLEATLVGFFDTPDKWVAPQKPTTFVVKNVPFDVIFQREDLIARSRV